MNDRDGSTLVTTAVEGCYGTGAGVTASMAGDED